MSLNSSPLTGQQYELVESNLIDVSHRCYDWVIDPEVNRFLSVRKDLSKLSCLNEYVGSFDHIKILRWYIVDRLTLTQVGTMSLNADKKRHHCKFRISYR